VRILISAGEASGEFYGAELMKALRKQVSEREPNAEIDFFGVYCPALNSSYLVPIADTARLSGSLRVHPTRNGQHSHVRWAQPYLLSVETIPKLVVVGPEGVDGVTKSDSTAPS